MRQAAKLQALAEGKPEMAPESSARLSVSLVGRLTLRFNGRLVELRTQKAGAVLSYLALIETENSHAGFTAKIRRSKLEGLDFRVSDCCARDFAREIEGCERPILGKSKRSERVGWLWKAEHPIGVDQMDCHIGWRSS